MELENEELYDKVRIGERLSEAYRLSGKSYKEFGESIGLNYPNLRQILNGNYALSPIYAKRIEKKYNISAMWLLYGDCDMYAKDGAERRMTHASMMNMLGYHYSEYTKAIDFLIINNKEVYEKLILPAKILGDIDKSAFVTLIDADYMAPSIKNNDLLIFQKDAPFEKDGEIHILKINDTEYRVYRVFKTENSYSLTVDNQIFSAFYNLNIPSSQFKSVGKFIKKILSEAN